VDKLNQDGSKNDDIKENIADKISRERTLHRWESLALTIVGVDFWGKVMIYRIYLRLLDDCGIGK
jgi:hypothetical protein